jgi:hypothetical protein
MPPFALNGFEHNGGGVVADSRAEGVDVVEGDIGEASRKRGEILAVFGLTGRGHGRDGASVKGVGRGHDAGLWSPPVVRPNLRAILSAASLASAPLLQKEDALEVGQLDKAAREPGLRGGQKDIRDVEECPLFLLHSFLSARDGCDDGAVGDPGQELRGTRAPRCLVDGRPRPARLDG